MDSINTKSKVIQVKLSEQERKMLTDLCEKFGSRISELLRSLIRDAHQSAFPSYMGGVRKVKEREEDLTDEQFCERWGGTVENGPEGGRCTMRMGGTKVSMPLTDRSTIEAKGKFKLSLKK